MKKELINKIKLTPRLQVIADMVRKSAVTADIGCDHGLVCAYLLQNNITDKIIAADINLKPLNSARKTLQSVITGNTTNEFIACNKNNEKQTIKNDKMTAETLLTDGLNGIQKADDIIIAGVGGELIIKIIGDALNKIDFRGNLITPDVRLILQPMTHTPDLRHWLFKNGFNITNETAVVEKNQVYIIIQAEKPLNHVNTANNETLIYGGLTAQKTDKASLLYAEKNKKRLLKIINSKNEKADYYNKILEKLMLLPAYEIRQ